MTISILDGVLRAVGMFHPELKSLIDVALKYETQIEKIEPIIVAVDKEGSSALAAAEKAAPDLAKAIHDFVDSLPSQAPTVAAANKSLAVKKEAVVRNIFTAAPLDNNQTWAGLSASQNTGG